jgi:hypothetical protein
MHIQSDFLRPKLIGPRFEGHAIPLELLSELAVLEPMVIEMAKWRYIQVNQARKRSPRKFTEGISLTLTSVDEGSAIAAIALSLAVSAPFTPSNLEYFEQARDAIVGAIAAVSENKSPIPFLPPKGLAYFDRLGRSLAEGEAIEFPSNANVPARLTKETRLRLLNAAQITERTEDITIRGGIHAINQEEMTFEIILPEGNKIPGPLTKPHLDAIVEASYQYRKGVKALIDGVGKYSQSDRLQEIESVEHVVVLDQLDFQSQLDELRTLKDGWYDGKGYAPPVDALDWLADMFSTHYSENLELPYVYPVPERGVRLEWSIGRYDVSLNIDLQVHAGDWHSLNLDTDKEMANRLNLDTKEAWDWMTEHLQKLGGATA